MEDPRDAKTQRTEDPGTELRIQDEVVSLEGDATV